MNAIDRVKIRLQARADLNGDGKVDKRDIETVIDQITEAFVDDKAENIGWAAMGFGAGVVSAWLIGWFF